MEKENLEEIFKKPQKRNAEMPQIEKELSLEITEHFKHENRQYRDFFENYRKFLKNISEYKSRALEKISEVKKAKYLRFVNLAQCGGDTKFFKSYKEMMSNKTNSAWSKLYGKPKILGAIIIKSGPKTKSFLFKQVFRELGAAAVKDPETVHPIFDIAGKIYWPVAKSDVK